MPICVVGSGLTEFISAPTSTKTVQHTRHALNISGESCVPRAANELSSVSYPRAGLAPDHPASARGLRISRTRYRLHGPRICARPPAIALSINARTPPRVWLGTILPRRAGHASVRARARAHARLHAICHHAACACVRTRHANHLLGFPVSRSGGRRGGRALCVRRGGATSAAGRMRPGDAPRDGAVF